MIQANSKSARLSITAVFLALLTPVFTVFAFEKTIMLPNIPEPVTSFGATAIQNKIYCYGGHFGQAHRYSTADQSNTLWELDLESNQWRKLSHGPRLQGLALVAHKNALYRLGGFTALNSPEKEHDLWSQRSFARFDLKTEQWSLLDDLPEGRSSFDAVVHPDGTLYVVGGWQMRGEQDTIWHQTAWTYDLHDPNAKWTPIAYFPYKRRAISMAPTKHGIIVVGGIQDDGTTTSQTVFYDSRSNQWSDGPSLIGESELTGFGTASCNLGDTIVVSTFDGSIQTVNAEGVFEVSGKSQQPRFFHQFVPLSPHQGLILGGTSKQTGKCKSLEIVRISPQN